MNSLDNIVGSIPEFASFSHADKIRFFAWYCLSEGGKESFTAADIRRCYFACDLAEPSSVAPFLNEMVRRSPRELLRLQSGYRLERVARNVLDEKYGPFAKRPAAIHVDRLLEELPKTLHDKAERAYLEEALLCFRIGAFRAAIVMTWNVAYEHLCQHLLNERLIEFNRQLPITYPRADIKQVLTREDFRELKESQVLQVCKSARIIGDGVHKIAKEKLDRRNLAAHPSGVTILQSTAEEFVRELVENFILKVEG